MDNRQSENDTLFLNAFNYAAIGMALVAPDGNWLKVNNALCAIIGYSEEELMGKTFQDITHPDDLDEDLMLVQRMLAGHIDTYQMEKRYFHSDGHIIHVLLSVSLVKDQNQEPLFFISQIQDISQRKQLESDLSRMAREDELTKVFNRRYFYEIGNREVIRGNRFRESQALMMIDIDHFKRVNDTYGHETGDIVLRAMAEECGRSLRSVDVFGRLGGEEFAALLLNTDSEIARMLAERIRKRIEDFVVETPEGLIQFTISIGLVTFTESNLPLDALLKLADKALYTAKGSGRNKVVMHAATPDPEPLPTDSIRTSLVRLEWEKGYESGCQTIDRQHRGLFLLANDLLGAIISGAPDTEVDSIANDLMKDMIVHFRSEDMIFRKAGYPGADVHSRIHAGIIQDMESILKRFKKQQASVADLFNLLAIKVIKEHFLTEDRQFFPYLRSIEPC